MGSDADRQRIKRLVELIAVGKEADAVDHLCRTTGLSPQEAMRHVKDVSDAIGGGAK